MVALRFLSFVFLLLAAVALAADLSRTGAAGGDHLLKSLGQHWSDLAPNAMAAARRTIQTGLGPAAWDYGLAPALKTPATLAFAAFGLLLGYLGRHRRRINIFAN
jgi:hypothetical protein